MSGADAVTARQAAGDGLVRRASGTKLERRKLSTIVADLITETILEDGLQPGAKLPPEREMLEQLGVGRGTLREALRLLEAEGLLSIRTGPHGGPVVEQPSVNRLTRMLLLVLMTSGASLRHVYEARTALDPLLARLAAENATPEQIEELRRSVTAMKEQLGDEQAFLDVNGRFHRLVAEASQNLVLVAFSLSMLDIIDGYGIGIRTGPRARRWVADIHDRIVGAIEARDPDEAARLAAEHVEGATSYFERRYPGRMDDVLKPRRSGRGER